MSATDNSSKHDHQDDKRDKRTASDSEKLPDAALLRWRHLRWILVRWLLVLLRWIWWLLWVPLLLWWHLRLLLWILLVWVWWLFHSLTPFQRDTIHFQFMVLCSTTQSMIVSNVLCSLMLCCSQYLTIPTSPNTSANRCVSHPG